MNRSEPRLKQPMGRVCPAGWQRISYSSSGRNQLSYFLIFEIRTKVLPTVGSYHQPELSFLLPLPTSSCSRRRPLRLARRRRHGRHTSLLLACCATMAGCRRAIAAPCLLVCHPVRVAAEPTWLLHASRHLPPLSQAQLTGEELFFDFLVQHFDSSDSTVRVPYFNNCVKHMSCT